MKALPKHIQNVLANDTATLVSNKSEDKIEYVRFQFSAAAFPKQQPNIDGTFFAVSWVYVLKSLGSEATPLLPIHAKGLIELAILPNYRHPWMLCIALQPCQKVLKADFQSQFSMSKIILIFLIFFSMKNNTEEDEWK